MICYNVAGQNNHENFSKISQRFFFLSKAGKAQCALKGTASPWTVPICFVSAYVEQKVVKPLLHPDVSFEKDHQAY